MSRHRMVVTAITTASLILIAGCQPTDKDTPSANQEQRTRQSSSSAAASSDPAREVPSSRSIRVLSPNGGEELVAGQPFAVRWSSQGLDDKLVTIKAHGGGDENVGGWYTLAEAIQNTGTRQCTFSGGWRKYKIHVSTVDEQVSDASDDFFAMKAPAFVPEPEPPRSSPADSEREALAALEQAGALFRIAPSGHAVDVSFADTQIDNATMARIAQLTDLQSLVLTNCKIESGGLKHVRGLKKLKGLRLRGTNVSDAGLVHFAGLTELIALDLQETQVAKAALERLAMQLPNCSIIADGFHTHGRPLQ